MKSKRGFTLAETLLVFVIIGIIASMTIAYVKPWDRTYKHIYSRIYAALNKTVYNDIVEQAKFPEDNSEFCKALFRWMNTPDDPANSTCNNPIASHFDVDAHPTDMDFKSGGVTLSNGSTIYIGSDSDKPFEMKVTKDPSTGKITYSPSGTEIFKYFLVYVDLNGKGRKPNYMGESNGTGGFHVLDEIKNLPDIVAFAVTDRGTVIPLGAPQYDVRYLQAHYVEPSLDLDADDIVSSQMPYRVAQILALGTSTDKEIISNTNHFTASDLIQDQLQWCSSSSNHAFCVNWDGIANKEIYDGKNLSDISTISPNCELDLSGCPNCDPPCYIKIYDYH